MEIEETEKSNNFMCIICDGLSDTDCHNILLDRLIKFHKSYRLKVLKNIFNGHCTGVSDYFCLAYLEELLLSFDDDFRLVTLKKACMYGLLIIEGSDINEPIQCPLCENMGSNDCGDYLVHYIMNMPNKIRLDIGKNIFGDGMCSEAITENDCLDNLDSYLSEVSNTNRLSTLQDACSAGFLEVETQLKFIQDDSCQLCSSLSNADCLTKMSTLMNSFDDKTRLQIEKVLFHDSCDGQSDKDCLALLDSNLASLSDTDRFSLLKEGCSNGLFESTPQINIELIATETESFGLWVAMVGMISCAIGILAYINRRKLIYSSIPSVELEI